MLKNGTYAAWFKTPLGEGTGIAHLADGTIWGQDNVMTYSGSCEIDGDRFTAIVKTKRHAEGLPTLFGDGDELDLKLVGTCTDKIARYAGTAEQAPDVPLEGTLILSEQQPRVLDTVGAPAPFNPHKLPKLPKRPR